MCAVLVPSHAALRIQCSVRAWFAKKRRRAIIKTVFEKVFDQVTGRFFYYNTRTGVSSWHKPRGLGSEELEEVGQDVHESRRSARSALSSCALQCFCARTAHFSLCSTGYPSYRCITSCFPSIHCTSSCFLCEVLSTIVCCCDVVPGILQPR